MLTGLIEHVFQHTALCQPQIGQLPVPARQRAMQRPRRERTGTGQLPQGGLDKQVDVALQLVEHGVSQQSHIIAGVAQCQLQDRHRFPADHAPGRQQAYRTLFRLRRMAQYILQPSSGKGG
ncbi:hypothetical protein D3C81_1657630 [compost metagenome]